MDDRSQVISEIKLIIRDWLTIKRRSLRDLAALANVNVSQLSKFLNPANNQKSIDVCTAIKLYDVLHEDLTPIERQTFLRAFGLLGLAVVLQQDAHVSLDVNTLKKFAHDPHLLGTALMHWANRVAYSSPAGWEVAIPIFRDAEAAFGSASTNAARAACGVTLQYLTLTDYISAEAEITRIAHTYGAVMDPSTKAQFYGVQGWLSYYLGDYSRSEEAFLKHVELADSTGVEYFADSIRHFLGRLYCDWAQSTKERSLRAEYFRKAAVELNKSHRVNMQLGDERSVGYDRLRQAQLLRAQGRDTEAQNICNSIRETRLFSSDTGADLSIMHLKLEEVGLALAAGANPRTVKNGAEEVLGHWAEVKYGKGMADALHIMGAAKATEGKVEEALVLYVAALVLYPFEGNLRNRQVWDTIGMIREDMIDRKGPDTYHKLLQQMQEQIGSRRGYFSYLDRLAANRSNDINRILLRLERLK